MIILFCFHDVATAGSLLTRPVLSKKLKVARQLDRRDFKSEILRIHFAKLEYEVFSDCLRFQKSISLPSVVTKLTSAIPQKHRNRQNLMPVVTSA